MLHKHDPISENEMEYASPRNTICERLRKIYHAVDDPDVKLDCRVATSMAKSMSDKLSSYQRNWQQGFFGENERFPVVLNKKPIDVLFLAYDDNANTGYRFWKCAQCLGLNSVMFKAKPHAFGYPMQAPVHPSLSGGSLISNSPTTIMAPGLESLINASHVVHLIASTYPMAAVNWGSKNVVVQHGGTVYRQHPAECNAVFNQIADTTVIQMPDLLGLGARNEKWIYYPVDTVALKPDFSMKGTKPVVGHFPSNSKVKGTETIERVVSMFDDLVEYVGSTETVPWEENLKRMSKCDIIIEACNPVQGNKPYGEWGNMALEAAALGCSVITHCTHKKIYENEFGKFGPMVANSAEDLELHLTSLLESNITDHKMVCRKWAEDNHSIPATANRLWDLVYKKYFG